MSCFVCVCVCVMYQNQIPRINIKKIIIKISTHQINWCHLSHKLFACISVIIAIHFGLLFGQFFFLWFWHHFNQSINCLIFEKNYYHFFYLLVKLGRYYFVSEKNKGPFDNQKLSSAACCVSSFSNNSKS